MTGDLSESARLTVADLRVWPRHLARVRFRCATEGERSHAFAGPLLRDAALGAMPGAVVPALRKDRGRYVVVVTGADGHQAVLSWAEIDPEYASRQVLLATRADGRPLDRYGPQLVVPHDGCGGRYISTITQIWIGACHASI